MSSRLLTLSEAAGLRRTHRDSSSSILPPSPSLLHLIYYYVTSHLLVLAARASDLDRGSFLCFFDQASSSAACTSRCTGRKRLDRRLQGLCVDLAATSESTVAAETGLARSCSMISALGSLTIAAHSRFSDHAGVPGHVRLYKKNHDGQGFFTDR